MVNTIQLREVLLKFKFQKEIVSQVLLHGAVDTWKESNFTSSMLNQLLSMVASQTQVQRLHLEVTGVLWVSMEMLDGILIPWDSFQLDIEHQFK